MLSLLLLSACLDYNLNNIQHSGTNYEEDTAYPLPRDTQNLDVLIVLDTSGSMHDDTAIYYGLSQIPNNLTSYNWQIALITTDPNNHLTFIIDSTEPEPGWAIIESIESLQNSYSAREQGIDAAIEFLDYQTYLRPNTPTLIVFVSDEDDQSEALPEELLLSWPAYLEITSIVGMVADAPGCTADYGERYISISDRVIDICTSTRWKIPE